MAPEEDDMATRLSALAVFAHPDDESFSCGGTLARLAAGGAEVNLICATNGEVGEISDPALATPENLGEVRREELRSAARALDIREPYYMGYRDSGMSGTPENQDPRCLHQTDVDVVGGKVVEFIRRLKPEVVFTFDAGGVYGHPDHIAIHRATSWAIDVLTRENGASLPSLYFTALPRGYMRRLAEEARRHGLAAEQNGNGFDLEKFGTPDELVTTVVNVGPYLDAKLQAIRSHRTQINPDNPILSLPEDMVRRFLEKEHFTLASHGAPIDRLAHLA
jgi:N-acetyl-1-D-myo-inositol-2-amino-2-deoxy-alpha-D-glucopyranoside deacetylase